MVYMHVSDKKIIRISGYDPQLIKYWEAFLPEAKAIAQQEDFCYEDLGCLFQLC